MWNLTSLQETGNVLEVTTWANNITDGLLFGLLCVAVFIIILIVLMRKNSEFIDSLLVSSWISFVLTLILSFAEFISVYYVLVFLAIGSFTAFFAYVAKR